MSLPSEPAPEAFVVYQHAGAKPTAFRLVEGLRAAMCARIWRSATGAWASSWRPPIGPGARWSLILGEEELAKGEVTLKDLRDGRDQQAVPQADAVLLVRHWLGEGA